MNTKFDEKIELLNRTRSFNASVLGEPTWSELRNAVIFVTDTLDLCVSSAKALFEEEAAPEVVFDIYDRVIKRLQELSNQL